MITPEEGVVIAQRYLLTRPLAQGGMGSVWIARHRDLEVDVTIKFMAPSLIASADARMRFEREARAAARLDSQYVVQVHDYGVEDGTPYLVMELLKGESLWTRLAREGALPLEAAALLLVQVCKALRTAHEAGLVHRDLKPGNVFLALKDGDEVVKVLDFGIAKTTDLGEAHADTATGAVLGSAHYMSPEQIRSSKTVDHRSDLWSVGVLLYRVLAGRLPFPGKDYGDVLVRVCTEPFAPLSSIVPDLPAGVDAFMARVLDRDPERRFQSAAKMAEAFTSVALGATAPPVWGPPSSSRPAWSVTSTPTHPDPPARPVPALVPGSTPVSGSTLVLGGTVALAATPALAAASPSTPAPSVPPAPLQEPASQISSLNVTSPPRRPNRRPVMVVVLAPLALLAIVAGVALLRMTSQSVPAAASAEPAPLSSSSPSPSSASALSPIGSVPAPGMTATRAPPTSVDRASRYPAAATPAQPPAHRQDCTPPYTVDSRGVRIPKMECL